MSISSITSFFTNFTKKNKQLTVLDTLLIKRLKNLSSQSNLIVFQNVSIYHHTQSYFIPLIVIDEYRGIYLFETKEWTYDELKNADIQKAEHQDSSDNTLAFENSQSIIRKKFNELIDKESVPIFNYLLMENLNADQYEHLNASFKELLPKEKIIFSDADETDIFKKLQAASEKNSDLLPLNQIISTVFPQYSILGRDKQLYHANDAQVAFINKEIEGFELLSGDFASGKSNLLLLKVIVILFNDKSKKVLIIKPTNLACDILKKKLLDIIERAIIEIDLTAVEILTPLELLNRHQKKLNREALSSLNIDAKLMKKPFNIADIIMCDDANLYTEDFLQYLNHIQKKSQLLLVNTSFNDDAVTLRKNYRLANKKINFFKTNPHAKAMHIVASLLQAHKKNILVVSNTLSMQKLKDDLDSFIHEEARTLDSSIDLINQKFTNLLLCTYADINEIKTDHIILMDLCFSSENEIEYAFNLSNQSVDVLYEEDCIEIKNLRIKYESSKK